MKAEQRIQRLNEVLTCFRGVSQLIVRERDTERLIQGVCDRLVECGCYKGAWIALTDADGQVEFLADAGVEPCVTHQREAISRGEWPPTSQKAFDSRGVVVVQDPARECDGCFFADVCQGDSGMIVSLEAGEKLLGLFCVQRASGDIFPEEIGLFEGIASDISYAIYSLRALKESELRFKGVVEQIPAIVYMASLDETSPTLYLSPQIERYLGYSPEEFMDEPERWAKRLHPDDRERVLAEVTHCHRTGEPFSSEYRMISRDGREVWFRDEAVLVRDEKGEPKYIQGVMLEITRERSAEEENRRMQAQLLRMQKMDAIGTLVAGVAHDFNNMLTAVQGYVELALMDLDEKSALYSQLSQVYKTSLRAADLVKKLLLFSRKQSMYMMAVNLRRLVSDIIKMLDRLLGENIRIRPEFPPDLWPVWGDLANLEQMIVNLSINAKDAMPDGGQLTFFGENIELPAPGTTVPPGIRPGKFVHLAVKDTGVGMTSEVMEHIFEPFFTTKELGHGNGLGLSITYGIIKEHRGWIECESRPGEGSTFHVYLPAAETSLVGTTPKNVLKSIYTTMHSGRVLVVEDEEAVCKLAVEVLGAAGYDVIGVQSLLEAREVFKREKGGFDVLFSDVVLPDGSGVDLARELKEQNPGLKALFTTGYADQVLLEELRDNSDHSPLQKPFSISDLLDAVAGLLPQAKFPDKEG